MVPYKEYVNYMIRYYFARGHVPQSGLDAVRSAGQDMTETDWTNYIIAATVISQLPDSSVKILRDVYSQSEQSALAQAVRDCAKSHGVTERSVWGMIRSVSREIARKRGLI